MLLRNSVALLTWFLISASAFAQSIELVAPETAQTGAALEVGWTGNPGERDFITIQAAGTPDKTYKGYQYAKKGPSVTLRVPDVPGDYEIRMLQGAAPYPVLARRALTVTDVTATLSAADSVAAGSRTKISWTGPDFHHDFITVVAAGSPPKAYKTYQYTDRGNPVELKVPDEPGEYEFRYLTGASLRMVASRPVTVTATNATISAPQSVEAGASFDVEWTGPDNEQDYITIVAADAKEGAYDTYGYTKSGATLTLRAPDEPGDYELRYATGASHRTLGRAPITVTGTGASLEAVASVIAGAEVAVTWKGPNNKQDHVLIAAKDAADRTYDYYTYTERGNPVTIRVPETPGAYELRYATGQTNAVLARRDITVTPVTASLEAPATVEARTQLTVTWEGPGNTLDFVIIVPKGRKENSDGTYARVSYGRELLIDAPREPGEYEIRYVTGYKGNVLATNPLTVTPTDLYGKLSVIREGSGNDKGALPAVAVILDASGSMLQRMEGRRRIEIAREAVIEFVNEALADNVPFALRVFGHREAGSCRTDLEIPLAPLDKSQVTAKVNSINAMNLAKTPIAASLELIAADLAGAPGPHLIVLVTDGEETCEGDPATAIKHLAASGMEVSVNIVGFGIDERMLKDTFAEWAKLGGGRYFDAHSADQLKESMRATTRVPYDVVASDNAVIASGVVNGAALELPAGDFTVRVAGESGAHAVTIKPDESTRLDLVP